MAMEASKRKKDGKSGRKRAKKPDCYFPAYDEGDRDVVVPRGDLAFPNLSVTSADIGTANFAIGLVTLVVTPGTEGKEWRVLLEKAAALNLKGGETVAGIEKIVEELFYKLNAPRMAWLWSERDRPLLVERQVDQIQGMTKGNKSPHQHAGKATMHAVYAALKMLSMARTKPLLCMSERRSMGMGATTEQLIEELKCPSPFTPVSGHQKAGLRGVHGDERKVKTGDVAIAFLTDDEQHNAADWLNSLARQKPQEDVADIYLQARRYLEDRHNERLKAVRKAERALKKRAREEQLEEANKRARTE